MQANSNKSSLRGQCTILRDYPFNRFNICGSLLDLFPEESPYRTLALNVRNYELHLATSQTLDDRRLRSLLGDPSVPKELSANLAANTAGKDGDNIAALLAIYRLFDLEILCIGNGPPIPPTPRPQSVTPQMIACSSDVETQWIKLEKWQKILIDFKKTVQIGIADEQKIVKDIQSDLRGSLAHLQGLAESHSNIKFQKLVQNFRGAAMHYTLIKETARSDNDMLPGIPDTVVDIVERSQYKVDAIQLVKYEPATREKMKIYLQDHKWGELSLPLHLSLLLSPLFMLMPINLVKSRFPRASIYELSSALGNQKPEILACVENEIWKMLWTINEDSRLSVVTEAFITLIASKAFSEAIALPPTDPAFSFFAACTPSPQSPQLPLPQSGSLTLSQVARAGHLSQSQASSHGTFRQLDELVEDEDEEIGGTDEQTSSDRLAAATTVMCLVSDKQ